MLAGVTCEACHGPYREGHPEESMVIATSEDLCGICHPAFYADVRGEAFWDMAILWTLPVAGILLLVNSPLWAYFELVGGGMYLYLPGRGIATRLVMQRRGIRIGKPETLKLYYVFFGPCGA